MTTLLYNQIEDFAGNVNLLDDFLVLNKSAPHWAGP